MSNHKRFIRASKKKAFDIEHRNKLKFNILEYQKAFNRGLNNYENLDFAKTYVSEVKEHSVNNLHNLLINWENQIASRGTHVQWAFDKKEALQKIENIIEKHQIKMVVKSKSMISEELNLNHFFQKKGVEPVETDLGEFIVQLEDQPPYHILTPAMHKSKEDVARLFHEKFGTDLSETPENLTNFTRKKLRGKYLKASAGISGANFLIADIGGIALTENEGNGIMSVAYPKVHIVIAGIEKIVPTINDLGKIWPILSQYGTGQQLTVYNSIFTGPKKENEIDGPEHLYVILLDNGRSKLLNTLPQNEALKCIRCGACLNVCPIYQNIGGHAYNTAYTGPIGSVITPVFRGKTFDHLADACSLCGKCTETCPVKIPLHELILHNRNIANNRKINKSWKWGISFFRFWSSHQNKLDMFNDQFKNTIFNLGKNKWGKHRKLPKFENESFSEYWLKNK